VGAPVRPNMLNMPKSASDPTTMKTRDEFRSVSVTEANSARKADMNWKLQISNNQCDLDWGLSSTLLIYYEASAAS